MRAILLLFCSAVCLLGDSPLFRFVLVSDVHIGRTGIYTNPEPWDNWRFFQTNFSPAFLIANGDLTENGFDAEYLTYTNLVQTWLTCPSYHLAGNHDDSSFAAALGTNHFSFTNEGFAFIGFNSFLIEQAGASNKWGAVTPEEVSWVSNCLVDAQSGDLTPLLFTHFRIQQDTLGYTNAYATVQPIWPDAGGRALTNLCTQFGVPYVFTGHEHTTNQIYLSAHFTNIVVPSLGFSLWSADDLTNGAFNAVSVYTDRIEMHCYRAAPGNYERLTHYDRILPLAGRFWFVDSTATGANSGTSWTDAWQSLTNIQWASVAPGDTVYISGGPDGLTYSNALTITVDGTESQPIAIRVSQEEGRNGLVTINASGQPAITARDWITISGAASDTYGTNHVTNAVNVLLITNNIRLKLIGGHGVNYTRTGPAGLKLYWTEIVSFVDGDNLQGIRIANQSPYNVTNNEIAYCWIHDIAQDGINNPGGNSNPGWDRFTVHHCLIERTGDDGLEVGSGWTVHHCILRDTRHLRGHPDGIQSVGNYQRYYNNIFEDWSSSSFITQGAGTNYGPLQIYGNLIVTHERPQSATAVELKWYPLEVNSAVTSYWSDWVFANNTIANSGNGALSTPKRYFCTNAVFSEMLFVNNILWNSSNYVGGINHGSDGLTGGTWWEPPDDVRFDYNVVSGSNAVESFALEVYGTHNTAEDLNTALGYSTNTSALPVFVSSGTWDYRLAESDTVARGTGTNLTVLDLPGFTNDLFGRFRGSGAWDRGAVIYGAGVSTFPGASPDEDTPTETETNMLVHLTFESAWSDYDYISDASGSGNHAWKFGRVEDGYNWPTWIAATNISGGATQGYAADFLWAGSDWGAFNKSGQYAGITNTTQLAAMTNATIMLWAYYAPATRVSPELTWTAEQNATLLSAGTTTGNGGAWDFGRFDSGPSAATKFQVYSASTNDTEGRYLVTFPDAAASGTGTTTNWHHYAITWSNGVVRGYFQGTNFHSGTVDMDNGTIIQTLSISQNSAGIGKWIGVGCNTHGGTPPLEAEDGEDYPNHGWFNGAMDDVRIYNRVLTSSEISAIYGSNEAPPASAGQVRTGRVTTGLWRGRAL